METKADCEEGVAFFKDLKEALEDLPEKKLGHGHMFNVQTECFCAVGALLKKKNVFEKRIVTESWRLLGYKVDSFSRDLLYKTFSCNDARPTESKETRWQRVMFWAGDWIRYYQWRLTGGTHE